MDISALAQRIIDLDYYEFMDNDATIETVSEDITNDPLTVIAWLLDTIDNLQA